MSANRLLAPLLALAALGGSAPPAATGPDKAAFQAIRTACQGKTEWSDPAPPARIFGNLYYVGTCNITVLLLTSPKGHVVIDSGPDAPSARRIAANIRQLGFAPRDVKWLLSTHDHWDHVGGLAELQRLTGAKVAARAPMAAVFTTGKPDPADPQAAEIQPFTPVRTDRILADGEVVSAGPLRLTALATPAHTAGSTSWTFNACTGRICRRVVYLDSITPLGLGGYRFTDHPAWNATFRATMDRIASLPCGIVLTPHPSASALFERLSGTAPLSTPDDCRTYAAGGRAKLDTILADEAKKAR